MKRALKKLWSQFRHPSFLSSFRFFYDPIFAKNNDLNTDMKINYISVLHDIFFAFQPHFAGFFEMRPAAISYKILPANNICLDESLNKISVNDAGGISRFGAIADCPGAGFGLCGG